MSFKFNLLWLDDRPDWQSDQEDFLKEEFKSQNLILKVTAKSKTEEFLEILEKETDSSRFYKYDLILIDYKLSEDDITGDKITGDQLIVKLRKLNVYSDILFYSRNEKEMREQIKKASEFDNSIIEGTYVRNRDHYREKLFELVDKNMQRRNSVVDLRGVLMDTTAEFDFIMKESVCALYDELVDPDKKTISKKIEEAINSAKNQSDNNFTKVEKAFGKDKIKEEKKSAKNKPDNNFPSVERALEKNEIEAIFHSIYYTMNSEDKYKILQEILEKKEIKIFEDFPLENYNSKVIGHRNKLAHRKVNIGKCYQHLFYYDKLKELSANKCADCGENNTNRDLCEQDTKKYSCDKCQEIRTDLFKYWEKFQDLFNEISKS